jgi:hypothetical protein
VTEKAALFAAVLLPVAGALALSPQWNVDSRMLRRIAFAVAALSFAAACVVVAFVHRRDAGDPLVVATNVTPWTWGANGPSLRLAFRINRQDSWCMAAISAVLIAGVAASGVRANEIRRLAPQFLAAGAALGAAASDELPLALVFALGAPAAVWLTPSNAPPSLQLSIMLRLFLGYAAIYGLTLSRTPESPLSVAGSWTLVVAFALIAAIFPFHGWLPQFIRTAGRDGAVCVLSVLAAALIGRRTVGIVAVPPQLLRECLAASAVLASLSSFAEPHLGARLAYLLSASAALAASRTFQFDALGEVLGWSYLGVSCLGAAGMFGAVENQTWRGDRSCVAIAILWSVAPLTLLVPRPAGEVGFGNPQWAVWLFTLVATSFSAISLVRLTAAAPKTASVERSWMLAAARLLLLVGMLVVGWMSLERLAEAAPRIDE